MQKNKRIFVDGDGCPVLEEIINCACEFKCPVIFVYSYAHARTDLLPSFVQEVVTDPDREAVDMEICNRASIGDITVTQDLGLAGLLLAKGVVVLSPRGNVIENEQIDFLLDRRHEEAKKRKAGKKTRGPKKLREEDRHFFEQQLKKILSKKKEF
ncbi:DUF188 domain-containing protein [Salipaludibacillus sp. LMS25]|jgi:uncharacterized protein YaiI (UPF0178 family)|uniref:DUF188 domain-containing protein n=1 Tax=Salipaludibacillus sp. LMS25 TaxID=2924031 RepID=UPI0020D0381D|nr:DUF188 domain-containing protein [Salipaludibacillus sp. LMS25]UTR14387.1 DUF188 domain-containing protein [Salipaludibacillus sp. LMS25]